MASDKATVQGLSHPLLAAEIKRAALEPRVRHAVTDSSNRLRQRGFGAGHRGIDRFAVGLRVQRGIAVEVGLERDRTSERKLDVLGFRQWPQPQLLGRAHCEVTR